MVADGPGDVADLAGLAGEQSMWTPAQPVEDNASFNLLPVVVGVIVIALVLLYFVAN